MKIVIYLGMCLSLSLPGINAEAHRPTESHTSIRVEGEELVLELELPWSIAEAVKKEFPEITEPVSKEEFTRLLSIYITRNLEISHLEKVIPMKQLEQLPGTHGHSSALILRYAIPDTDYLRIKNTLLFNWSDRQKNYHQVKLKNQEEWSFVTDRKNPYFLLDTEQTANGSKLFFPILLVLVLVWLVET